MLKAKQHIIAEYNFCGGGNNALKILAMLTEGMQNYRHYNLSKKYKLSYV